jgi:hypothetical protein
MGSEKDGEVAQQNGNLKSASPTHFKSTIVGIALPQPMPFENETSQMSREIEAQNGVRAKSLNNFVAQWHCGEGIITIVMSKKHHNIFKQFQQATMKVTILGQMQGTNLGLKALQAWAFMNLHESLHNFAQVGNGFFETTFSTKVGNKHALENSFNYERMNIVFSNLTPWIFLKHGIINCITTTPIMGSILGLKLVLEEY